MIIVHLQEMWVIIFFLREFLNLVNYWHSYSVLFVPKFQTKVLRNAFLCEHLQYPIKITQTCTKSKYLNNSSTIPGRLVVVV